MKTYKECYVVEVDDSILTSLQDTYGKGAEQDECLMSIPFLNNIGYNKDLKHDTRQVIQDTKQSLKTETGYIIFRNY